MTTTTLERPSAMAARLPAIPAFAFAGTFIGSLIVGLALGEGVYPTPFVDARDIQTYFLNNHDAVTIQSFVQVMSSLWLLGIAGTVGTMLRGTTNSRFYSPIAVAATVAASASLAFSAATSWIMVRPGIADDLPLLQALSQLAFLTGGPVHVATLGVLVIAVAVPLLREKVIPRALGVVGVVAAVLSLASITSLLTEATTPLLPIGRFLAIIWLVSIGVVLIKRANATKGKS